MGTGDSGGPGASPVAASIDVQSSGCFGSGSPCFPSPLHAPDTQPRSRHRAPTLCRRRVEHPEPQTREHGSFEPADDEHRADDLVQDAWVAALSKEPSSIRRLGGWLAAAVRRRPSHDIVNSRRRAEDATGSVLHHGASTDGRASTESIPRPIGFHESSPLSIVVRTPLVLTCTLRKTCAPGGISGTVDPARSPRQPGDTTRILCTSMRSPCT